MTSFTLKIIALISMFCDHFGDVFLGHFSFFNLIGRLAFPIFAFQISEGYIHTRDVKKYFLRLGIFALISQIPFSLFYQKIFNTSDLSLNVFFTLLIGLLAIYLYDCLINKTNNLSDAKSCNKKDFSKYISIFLGIILVILLAYTAQILNTDYGAWGVIVVFMFYILKKRKLLTTLLFLILCIIKYIIPFIQSNFNILYAFIILFTFFPIIFINMYNGKQGLKIKYLLYIFYPLHLLLLYFIF